jgi:hydroxymethylbilane synthase
VSDRIVRLGTRGSALARWQTAHVADLLRAAWPVLEIHTQVITTQGDRVLDTPLPMIGGKGVFTAELEAALHSGEIDYAVHSLKDLPTENPPGLVIGAILQRSNPGDALISREGYTLNTLPPGAKVGTSSHRRAAQILRRRPDLCPVDIRGNVDTRISKALEPAGDYDAILLALAGLERLGQTDVISERLSLDDMLPAPGQGALVVQCRDEHDSLSWLQPLNHTLTQLAVTAERAFLAGLGGGCSLPAAAYAEIVDGLLHLRGRVCAPDGSQQVDMTTSGAAEPDSARELGAKLAQMALAKGAAHLLEELS